LGLRRNYYSLEESLSIDDTTPFVVQFGAAHMAGVIKELNKRARITSLTEGLY
jgi:hypothetical protein